MDEDNEKLWATLKNKYQRQVILTLDAMVGSLWGGLAAALSFIVLKKADIGLPGFWSDVAWMLVAPGLVGAANYIKQRPAPTPLPAKPSDSSDAK